MLCVCGSVRSMKARFEKIIREAQDSICAAIEEEDGVKFHQDVWTRPGGGGGISRVLQVSGSQGLASRVKEHVVSSIADFGRLNEEMRIQGRGWQPWELLWFLGR